MDVIRPEFFSLVSWKMPVLKPFTLSLGLFAFDSGRRKERHLICQLSAIYALRTDSDRQFHDHREHRFYEMI